MKEGQATKPASGEGGWPYGASAACDLLYVQPRVVSVLDICV